MQEKFTRSPRRSATVRQRGSFAASFRPATSSDKTTRDWRARIVEGLVREQPSPVCAGSFLPIHSPVSETVLVARYFDDGAIPPRREALARVALKTSGIATSEIAAWVALGATQAHVGAKYGLTQAARRADRPGVSMGAPGRPGSAPEPR